jgi:hypothetical protein
MRPPVLSHVLPYELVLRDVPYRRSEVGDGFAEARIAER